MVNALILLSLATLSVLCNAARLEKRRFGADNAQEIQALRDLGGICNDKTGIFQTMAGYFIDEMSEVRDPCGRYILIDQLVNITRGGPCAKQGIDVARKLSASEKNFSPFAGISAKPAFCDNPALPATKEIRCIVPRIDPGFPGAKRFNDDANARLAAILATNEGNPALCPGMSVKQLAIGLGVSDCVGCAKY